MTMKKPNAQRVAQRYAAATTPKDVHALADELDISWDDDPGFMSWTKKVVGKEHLDDMSEKELRGVMSAMKSDPPKKAALDNRQIRVPSGKFKAKPRLNPRSQDLLRDWEMVTKELYGSSRPTSSEQSKAKDMLSGYADRLRQEIVDMLGQFDSSYRSQVMRKLHPTVVKKFTSKQKADLRQDSERFLSAKKVYSLPDFQRAAKEADKAVTDAYLSAHSLKAMWDTFEEIPPKQRKIYDNNMKVISLLGKARDESYQSYMDLKRYR